MYRIEWLRSARDQLAGLWVTADSELRADITSATHRLERFLSHRPSEVGESREFNERVSFFTPLVVQFAIDDETSTVTILDVRVCRPRG